MGSRVILADDSVTIQKVVGIIFANEGYELTIVASGDDAVAKAREIKPDVMLVDALMPGKNGYEVCREIRQDPSLAHTAILLMTGAFEVVDEEKNRQSGADEFITKPFDSQTLIEVTNRLISLTGDRRAISAAAPASQTLAASFPQAAAPAPAAAPAVDDIWATGFDDEPEPAPAVPASFTASSSVAPVVPAPVKATADDDLWGAFDMDEFETAPASAPAVTAADHGFSFGVDAPTATGFEPVGEQEISFADLEPDMSVQPVAALPADDEFGAITFDEPEVPVAAPLVAPPGMPVVAPAPAEPAAPFFAAPPPPAFEPAVPAALDEAQLKTLLSTVSREVIERIVWEVVPDLAEIIIKEEIRKLKAGTA